MAAAGAGRARAVAIITVALAVARAPVAVGQTLSDAPELDEAVSVAVGYGSLSVPNPEEPHEPRGTTLGIDYERGFSDAVWFRASAGGGVYFDGEASYAGFGVVGLTYQLDVFRYVPYATAGVGGIVLGGGPLTTDLLALVEFGVGLDVRVSQRFSLGAVARFETLVHETSFFTAGVRATWHRGVR